jgi:hypothetical protein
MSSCYSSIVAGFVQYIASFICPHKWQVRVVKSCGHREHWSFSLKFFHSCYLRWRSCGIMLSQPTDLTPSQISSTVARTWSAVPPFCFQTNRLAISIKCQESAYMFNVLFSSHLNFCAWFRKNIYRIFRPITRALSIQKRCKIVKKWTCAVYVRKISDRYCARYLYKKGYRKIRYYVLTHWHTNFLRKKWFQDQFIT